MQREGGEMKGRTPLSTLNTRCTQAMSKATASWGGSIALIIREGRSARGYLMRCRCERRLTQIEWGMGGNNATDCEEYAEIYAV